MPWPSLLSPQLALPCCKGQVWLRGPRAWSQQPLCLLHAGVPLALRSSLDFSGMPLAGIFVTASCVQASASITAPNFLAPGEDLGYKVEYRHPYFFSPRDPKRTALAVSIFNARKLSGVFTPGETFCRTEHCEGS